MPGDNNDFQADKKDSADEGPPVEQRLETQIREDQIQNAVTFLSHPKVRSSPASSKRAFLQQKGLTAEEIAEAFKRVPEVPGLPASPSTAVVPSPSPSQQQQTLQPPKPEPIRWSQIIFSTGLFAASAYTVKSLVWPYVHDAWNSWRGSKNNEEIIKKETGDGEGTNKEVATAVAEAIRAQTMELTSSIEALKELVCSLKQNSESASVEEKVTAADLRQELHSIAASLGEIAGPLARPPTTLLDISPQNVESELSEIKALLSEYLKTPRPEDDRSREVNSPPAHEPLTEAIDIDNQPPPNANLDFGGDMKKESDHVPTSYMDVLAILERGETPPGIRTDINDKPPNPEQPPPPARLKARPKPWERKTAENIVELESNTAALNQDDKDLLKSELGKPMPTQSIFEAATSPSRPSPSVIMERLASPASKPPSLISEGTTIRRPLPIDVNFQDSKTIENGGDKGVDAIGSAQGSGLGRPSSRGWKPPPIPVPTLTLPAPDKKLDSQLE